MKEYQKALDAYCSDEYQIFTRIITDEKWDKKVAEQYLKKYWLSKEEYERVWRPIQDTIFINQDKTLPHMMFADPYSIIALGGLGSVFELFDFKQLQKCMLALGDTHFVIIQQKPNVEDEATPLLYLKYPVMISWQEFMGGNYISAVLYDVMLFSFFVYSNSGIWGKYIDTDAFYYCVDLIGLKKEYTSMFKEAFPVTQEESKIIWRDPVTKKQDIPDVYKKRLISTISKNKYKLNPQEERKTIVDFYSDLRYSMYNSEAISKNEWENKKGAEEYLACYLVSYDEYERVWKQLQDTIFINQYDGVKEMIFADQYSIIALGIGDLFTKEKFEKLQHCMQTLGESNFVVIQSDFGGLFRGPLLRLQYPVEISWKDLKGDNFISTMLCEDLSYNQYFVYGTNGGWGLYSGVNLLGFKPEYTQLFKDTFSMSAEEEQAVWDKLPKVYTSGANRKRLVSTVK